MVQPLLHAPTMRVAATALAIAMASSGCAIIAAKAPDPDRPISEIPQCNTGKGGVAVDTVFALLLGASAIAVAKEDAGPGLLLGLTAGVYGLSASAGNSSANKCRKALDRYDAYIADERNAPGGLGGLAAAPGTGPGPQLPPAPPPKPVLANPYPPAPAPAPAVVPPKPVVTAAPTPAPTPPKPAPPPRPQPAASGPDSDDPWSAFWEEVP